MTFQDMILTLQKFWADAGCLLIQPYDMEMGAGTFHPATFFGALGSKPTAIAYPQACRRPKDGRYGENPNRFGHYYQFQVIIKPTPANIQNLYLQSLEAIGVKIEDHDIRFVEDDWESPTLGAWGLGWEVWLDGMEISQFTYFQQIAGRDLFPVSVELTYGLERLAMYIQNVDDYRDLRYSSSINYGDLFYTREKECSDYSFNAADTGLLFKLFSAHEAESEALNAKGLVYPAYDELLKCSHYFNLLDARGVISVTERAAYIGRIRDLAKNCATVYLKKYEEKDENQSL